MLNMKSAVERRAANCHARFKSKVYRSTSSQLFFESDPAQAGQIAELSSKPVFCVLNRQMYLPSAISIASDIACRLPKDVPKIGWRILAALRRRIMD